MLSNRFRWVFCQLETLQNCIPQNIRRVLRELPKSLDETYERMLKEVGEVNVHQAYRLLQCLTVATRPLRVEELAEVLALDFDGEDGIPKLNEDWRSDDQQNGVLSTCSSLILIVDGVDDDLRGCRVVQFANFSVKEFLTSDRLADLGAGISHFHIRLQPAHTVIAQACIAILLQSGYEDSVQSSSPLLKYAARYWVVHAQFENVPLRVEDGMRRLFAAKPYFAAWLNSYIVDKQWRSFLQGGFDRPTYYSAFSSKPTSSIGDHARLCLHYSSLYGFHDLVRHLLATYRVDVNARVNFNKRSLVATSPNADRHWQVTELLHQHGAAADVTGYENRTPLHTTSEEGMVDAAQRLLDHGAESNSQENDNSTPLHLAAANGQLEVVQTLPGHSVHVNAATKDNRTLLHEVSERGHFDIVPTLLVHGADVNARDGNNSTPLHLASSKGSSGLAARVLLDHGADVNARDGNNSTPLHLASSFRYSVTLRLLIQYGANLDAYNGSHKTPLHLALSCQVPVVEVVRLLLEHGANVDVEDDEGRTPFQIASSKGQSEITRLFSASGASVE
jgi:ankyrin repeat protein